MSGAATLADTPPEDPHGYWAQQLITNQVLYQLSYAGDSQILL